MNKPFDRARTPLHFLCGLVDALAVEIPQSDCIALIVGQAGNGYLDCGGCLPPCRRLARRLLGIGDQVEQFEPTAGGFLASGLLSPAAAFFAAQSP
jgi:hypothetical protein